MTFAHAIGAVTVLEQPVHLSTGGMQTHERFLAMCRLFTVRDSICNAVMTKIQAMLRSLGRKFKPC